MRSPLLVRSARLSAALIVVIFAGTMITPAFAFSVSVGTISNQDDVDDLRDDVQDEFDDAIEDLQDDCARGIRMDIDDEEDTLIEDIQDIYDDARDHASINFDDELDDDEDDFINDAEDEMDDLRDQGCDQAGSFNRNPINNFSSGFNGNFFSPFMGGFSGFNTGARVTTVTPLYNSFFSPFTPSFGQNSNGGCQNSFSSPFWNSTSCTGSTGGNSFGSMTQWGY